MSATRWIALHCGDETAALLENYPNAFLLLAQIAMRAQWKDCPIRGMKEGQALIGDWKSAGLHSKKAYEVAKKRLETCKLATFQGGNRGTLATLTDSRVFSLSAEARGEPRENPRGNRGETEEHPRGNPRGSTNTEYTETQSTRTQLEIDTPLIPLEGGTCQDRFLPKGWKDLTKEQRKRQKVNANSPAMERIGAFFGRRQGTLWTIAEGVALLELKPSPEDVDLLAKYYAKTLDKESDYRRRDLPTLLNNWYAEVDRARSHFAATADT